MSWLTEIYESQRVGGPNFPLRKRQRLLWLRGKELKTVTSLKQDAIVRLQQVVPDVYHDAGATITSKPAHVYGRVDEVNGNIATIRYFRRDAISGSGDYSQFHFGSDRRPIWQEGDLVIEDTMTVSDRLLALQPRSSVVVVRRGSRELRDQFIPEPRRLATK